MRFFQKHSVIEFDHGEQSVLFVVSDDYTELIAPLSETDIETNIIGLESYKTALNGENNTFVIDEMGFSINELACDLDADFNCLQFILKATNVNVIRYCSVYFGNDVSIDNRIFHGKINEKVSGDDQEWEGEEYDKDVRPKREYKFNAYAFDISILEKVKMNEQMEDQNGGAVLSVYQDFENDSMYSSFRQNMRYLPSYAFWAAPVGWQVAYNCPLIDLKTAISNYLSVANSIISQLCNANVTFSIAESSLGIKGSSVKITSDIGQNYFSIANITGEADPANFKKLLLTSRMNYESDESPILIHRKMIDPGLGAKDLCATEDTQNKKPWLYDQIQSEAPYSFKGFDNIAELLFAIAKNLGCYLRIIPNANGSDYEIKLISISEIKEDNFTYIKGVNSANIELSSNISDKITAYYSMANNYTAEGNDVLIEKSGAEDKSKKLDTLLDKIKYEEEHNNKEYKRLLFSTSPTIQQLNTKSVFSQLINTTNNANTTEPPYAASDLDIENLRVTNVKYADLFERLHNSLYIKTSAPEIANGETSDKLIDLLGNDTVYRPISQIHYNYDGTDKSGSLSDYINAINHNAKQYYETEYTLKVPFWNGFSKSESGADASWKNVKLGSVIKITDSIQVWHPAKGETAGYWSPQDVVREYMVVSIEINLKEPETTLKLQNSSLAAYGDYAGTDVLTPQSMIMTSEPVYDPTIITSYEMGNPPFSVPAHKINIGDAVMLLNNKQVCKTVSHSNYYGKTIGIALNGGSLAGDKILVQHTGEVFCETYNFANIGSNVFARTEWTEPNIFALPAQDMPNANENMIIQLGSITGPNSFILNIRNWEVI